MSRNFYISSLWASVVVHVLVVLALCLWHIQPPPPPPAPPLPPEKIIAEAPKHVDKPKVVPEIPKMKAHPDAPPTTSHVYTPHPHPPKTDQPPGPVSKAAQPQLQPHIYTRVLYGHDSKVEMPATDADPLPPPAGPPPPPPDPVLVRAAKADGDCPKYTKDWMENDLAGTVIVRITVSGEGAISAKLDSSCGHAELDKACVDIVNKKWKGKPALFNNEDTTSGTVMVKFIFDGNKVSKTVY